MFAERDTLINILWSNDDWFIVKDQYILNQKPTASLYHNCPSLSNGCYHHDPGNRCSSCEAIIPEQVSGFFELVKWGVETCLT